MGVNVFPISFAAKVVGVFKDEWLNSFTESKNDFRDCCATIIISIGGVVVESPLMVRVKSPVWKCQIL